MSPLQSQRRQSKSERVDTEHPWRWLVLLGVFTGLFLAIVTDGGQRLRELSDIDQHDWLPSIQDSLTRDLDVGQKGVPALFVLIAWIYAYRRYRQAELVRIPGPIHVVTPTNASGEDLNVEELGAAFRVELDRVDLRSPAPIPGGGQSTDFLDVLKSTEGIGTPVRTVAALLGLTRVSHAIEVAITLRSRDHRSSRCGVTVSVVILPRGRTTNHTVWAASWSEAIHDAAMSAGAAILPMTRLCRLPPWRDWQGRHLPPELFAAYLEGKSLAAEHRYDEALGMFYSALRYDPKNLFVRLEIGALQEQLQLFLDALETYDDLIALGSRVDERRYQLWSETGLDRRPRKPVPQSGTSVGPDTSGAHRPHLGAGWLGVRGSAGVRPAVLFPRSSAVHEALLMARYRYAMVLGFSEVFLKQWMADAGLSDVSTRDSERRHIRVRLRRRLRRYAYLPSASDTACSRDTKDLLRAVTPATDWTLTAEQLELLSRQLRQVMWGVKAKASEGHDCSDHGAGYGYRIARANAWYAGHHLPTASPKLLHDAAKSLIAAMEFCVRSDCEKEWHDDLEKVRVFTKNERLAPVKARPPSAVDGMRVQAMLQQAALTELDYLVADYRMLHWRRRHSMTVTQRALKVSRLWARLRCDRVEALLQVALEMSHTAGRPFPSEAPPAGRASATPTTAESGSEPDASLRAGSLSAIGGRLSTLAHSRPKTRSIIPQPAEVTRQVEAILRWRGRLSWQDHYVSACAYAVPLLPAPTWAGPAIGRQLGTDLGFPTGHPIHRQYAELAVRALERAMDSSSTSVSASTRAWVMSEDPDLVGVRGTLEFVHFRRRNFPGVERPVPLPKNIHVLQLSTYVTELLIATCEDAVAMLRDHQQQDPGTTRDLARLLASDRQAWTLVHEIARENRDWRMRLSALVYLSSTRSGAPPRDLSYPRYPDDRIGDLRNLTSPESEPSVSLAARNSVQERAVHLDRLAEVLDGRQIKKASDVRWLTLLTKPELQELLGSRIQLWEAVTDLLSIQFFTDSPAILTVEKRDAVRLESRIRELASDEATMMDRPNVRRRRSQVPAVSSESHAGD